MLSYLDPILFPDECHVLETAPDRYVYPIFKNGSSSLSKSGFRKLTQHEIRELQTIEVFVRDPFDRFVSGVQSFLKGNPHYDRETVINFIEQYLFLNRHFCLQFHWLVNLQRFTKANILLSPVSQLNQVTKLKRNQQECDTDLWNRFVNNDRLHFYLHIDRVLTQHLVGQKVKFTDIVTKIKEVYPDVYKEVIERSKDLCIVLD